MIRSTACKQMTAVFLGKPGYFATEPAKCYFFYHATSSTQPSSNSNKWWSNNHDMDSSNADEQREQLNCQSSNMWGECGWHNLHHQRPGRLHWMRGFGKGMWQKWRHSSQPLQSSGYQKHEDSSSRQEFDYFVFACRFKHQFNFGKFPEYNRRPKGLRNWIASR